MVNTIRERSSSPAYWTSGPLGAGNSVTFSLDAGALLSFLCRVAGALPGSFSNECLEDMLAFKAELLRKAEAIPHSERSRGKERRRQFRRSGALTLKFIEIEQNGHGFSRPVTVRVDA